MSHYEMDDTVEPARIVAIRRLRKLQRQGHSTPDTAAPLLNDLFEHTTRTT
ncbi:MULTISPECIES: hypothetical protein [unclassified Curtobacterium]|uniref:hypothetical protein n=1 Tax=unclassified Curtobacterium TaxID=257496 RepID=UPI0015E8851F|nr:MULTISPECIES: hypothetical protein [unclassified Curtobacterium]QZQ55562.1 hypothetical protein KZI27_01445 [Curtobacterium sp. TC1]WIE74142.1 hypothetical protein DEJ14_018710 [Curtobacterium sp. MCJR17_020]